MIKIEQVEKVETSKGIRINFEVGTKTCTKVLEINKLTIGNKNSPLFSVPEKIEVDWGNKIGIIDSNGSGKSTLLKTILDKYQADTSVVKIGPGIEIGYYAQAHEDLDPKKHTR